MADDERRVGGTRSLWDWEPEGIGTALRGYAADGRARTTQIGLVDSADTEDAPLLGVVETSDEPFPEDEDDEADTVVGTSVLLKPVPNLP